MIARSIIIMVISYLFGAIPVGLLAGKLFKGIDVREYGSGSIGATNVLGAAGPFAGLLTLLGDILKGVIPVLLAKYYLEADGLVALAGFIAVIGHDYTVFLGFRGGKGVSTSLGVLAALNFPVALFSALLLLAIVGLTRYKSLGSILALIFSPLIMVIYHQPSAYVLLGIALAGLTIYRHRENIERLRAGTEHKLGEKRARRD